MTSPLIRAKGEIGEVVISASPSSSDSWLRHSFIQDIIFFRDLVRPWIQDALDVNVSLLYSM